MAVDLIVSSLSKYWSGDYITPVMQDAWDIGANYQVLSPQGLRTIPKGTPWGGIDAKNERESLVMFVEQIMKALPLPTADPCVFEGAAGAWDEKSEHFGFYQVDPDVYGQLVKRASKQFTQKVGLIGRFRGQKGSVSHLGNSLIFMPIRFDTPFDLEGKVFASLQGAKNELDSGDWNGIPQEELYPFIDAFAEAIEMNLPLVVDL